MQALQAIILGIIEGLTEFLPISSTGHLVIAMPAMGIDADTVPWNVLLWVSQLGAICAVVLYFWRDLWRRSVDPLVDLWRKRHRRQPSPRSWQDDLKATASNHILVKLAVAIIPAAVIALPLKAYAEKLESMPVAVAVALILGAGVMEYIDRRFRRKGQQDLGEITLWQAFLIGLIQCVSIWPGVSRAGATIMGGMALGLTPRVATEFSFYLAIPTMLGAAGRAVWEHRHELHGDTAALVLIGSATAFVVALLVVMVFLGYVRRHRFTPFAVYRVLLGLVVLACYWAR